mmetsp:Transcript_17173/g.26791  ORF Transcript_17173/g.26791 Transcript_17173/m.26791 type:complete len:1218 (+) Transcript_17173:172-3825(+)|eukprot:CAMPEP_0196802322 /NCGR_PEP_ID=MMETSP1362-20130617/1949_1 /TAXON_ID=163516 /ORGANISM="Leptocylindrus danicus, Strain CCMP1856" /LENGTH=1217 /DNA_ID=CAMNT_0042173583 /DNA_START=173 /DNA_END=3826 /DNA_ORIENTATION=-
MPNTNGNGYHETSESAEVLQQRIAQMTKSYEELQARVVNRENKVLALSQKCERLEVKLSMTKSDDERMIRELRAKNSELTHRNAHVEADMMNQLSELASTMGGQMDALERDLKAMRSRVSDKEAEVKRLSAREVELEQNVSGGQVENVKLSKQVNVLKEKLSLLERQSIDSLNRMKDRFVSEKSKLEQKYNADQKIIAGLRDDIKSREMDLKAEHNEELAALSRRTDEMIEKLASKLRDRDEQLSTYEEKIKTLEAENSEVMNQRERMVAPSECSSYTGGADSFPLDKRREPLTPRSDYDGASVASSTTIDDSILMQPPENWKRGGPSQKGSRLTWRKPRSSRNDGVEIEELRKELAATMAARDELQQRYLDYDLQTRATIESLEAKMQERDSLILNHSQKIASLQEEIDEHVTHTSSSADQITNLKKRVEELEPQAAKRDEALRLLKSTEWEYNSARESHAEAIKELKQELGELSLAKATLQSKMEERDDNHKTMLGKMEYKVQEKDALISSHEETIASLTDSMKTKEESLDERKASMDKISAECEEKIALVAAQEEIIADLRSNLEKAQDFVARMEEAEKEAASRLETAQNSTKDEILALQAKNISLQVRVNEAAAKIKEMEYESSNLPKLVSDNEKLRQSLNKAMESLRTLMKGSADNTQLEVEYLDKISSLEKEISRVKAEYEGKLKERNDAVNHLRKSLTVRDKRIKALQSDIDNMTQEASPINKTEKDNTSDSGKPPVRASNTRSPSPVASNGRTSPAFSESTTADDDVIEKLRVKEDESNHLKETVAMLENKIDFLRKALNQFQAHSNGEVVPAWELLERLRQESELFAGQVIEQEQELELLTKQLETQKILNHALSTELADAKKSSAPKSSFMSNDMMTMELEDEISRLLRDLKLERAQNQELLAKLEESEVQKEGLKPALQKTLDQYKAKNVALEEEAELLRTNHTSLKKEVVDLQDRNAKLNDKLDRLSRQLEKADAEDDNMPRDVSQLRQRLQESEAARTQFEKTALDIYDRKIKQQHLDAQVHMNSLRKKLKEANDAKGKNEVALMNQITKLEKEKTSVKSELESKLRGRDNTILKLEHDLAQQQQVVKDLKGEMHHLRLSMSGVSEARKGEVEDLHEELMTAAKKLAKQEKELNSIKMSMDDTKMRHRHELKVLIDRINELEGEEMLQEYDDEQSDYGEEQSDYGDDDIVDEKVTVDKYEERGS